MKQIHGNARDAASYEVANLLLRVDTGYMRYHFRKVILPSLSREFAASCPYGIHSVSF